MGDLHVYTCRLAAMPIQMMTGSRRLGVIIRTNHEAAGSGGLATS